DALEIPPWPLDVLAQQIVSAAACESWNEDDLFDLVSRAYPYRDLPREDFDAVIEMLSEGIATQRGRSGAFLHRDQINHVVRGRRGEAPGRTVELSEEIANVRAEILKQNDPVEWLMRECALDRRGAEQAALYVRAGAAALGALPTQRTVVAERFFDEGGGMQLVVHAPFGARINRAWGLSLRKRFCRTFN